MILAGTVLTHVFGGSAGREGTALQMGGSLAEWLRGLLRLPESDRRALTLAGISGGFSAVFGTPFAGLIFALEAPLSGRLRTDNIAICLMAALVGNWTTRLIGPSHAHYPVLPIALSSLWLIPTVLLAGVVFGLTSRLFVLALDSVRELLRQSVDVLWRPFLGGLTLIALVWLLDTRDYLGLSLPLADAAVNGKPLPWYAFALKLLFTAITLGSGFLGGEVTPLFVIGATLGHALAAPLGVDPGLLASLGFVAVFSGASKTPLACAVMGMEVFGVGGAFYFALACIAAYLASGQRGIYTA
jgi:H+/Cl- antiporter ClcA